MSFDIKTPTSKEEMDEIRKSLQRMELTDDVLDSVAGGNDDEKEKGDVLWECPFCGEEMKLSCAMDASKHMTKCPNNPYK